MNLDVIVAGAGPAGAIAATLLARAGARVMLLDRAVFPRPKLCGDTLNPGALSILERHGLADGVERRGLRIDGMVVTGTGGVRVEGRYPGGLHGRSILRTELDTLLLDQARAAGVEFLDRTIVREPIVDDRASSQVLGVRIGTGGASRELRAPVTIAADGRHSVLAFGLGLTRHPPAPRRWAIGAYATNVAETSSCGEMHIRPGHYVGVAPLPDEVTNVCLVKPLQVGGMRDPHSALQAAIAEDPDLRRRFARAEFIGAPVVLGPLAISPVAGAVPPDGLLLAGDAAGFIDPMTGDGLRFALGGGELAAASALEALQHGWAGVQARLGRARRREFSAKWRFNRALRALVGSPAAVHLATSGARIVPSIVRAVIVRASDCDIARARSRQQPAEYAGAFRLTL